MRKYECVLVLHPGVAESDAQGIVDRFTESVKSHGGEVQQHDHWGRRELAYEIEKQTSGDYHFLKFTAENTLVTAADRDLRLDDKVLRHLIVVDEEWAERNRIAQAKRNKGGAEREAEGD